MTAKSDTAPGRVGSEELDAARGSFRKPHTVAKTEVARRAVTYADLPMPEHLPDRRAIDATIPLIVRTHCAAEIAQSGILFRRTLAGLRPLIPAAIAIQKSQIDFMMATAQPCDIHSHDHFFRIRRSTTSHAAAFLAGQIQTLHILQAELSAAPTRLDAPRIIAIADAVRDTIGFAIEADKCGQTQLSLRTEPLANDEVNGAVRRWLHGHQIFAGLCQALTFTLQALERAEHDNDAETTLRAGGLVADLLLASATALELTGDFPATLYDTIIRVSMDMPCFPAGFSGVLSQDHRQLVMQMKMMRPATDSLQRRDKELHARIGEALVSVYTSHKYVCARFVAPHATSLLMAAAAERSATEQIDRFRNMRLRAWGADCGGPHSVDSHV